MKVSIKKSQPGPTPSSQASGERKFNEAWQRVVLQQKKNDSLRADARAFAQDVQSRIEDKEIAYMDAMYFACLHLISFCSRKSLAQWHREILLEWADEYVDAMMNNPFSHHLDLAGLRQRMAEAIAAAFPALQPPHGQSADDCAFNEDRPPGPDDELGGWDMFEDLFAEFERAEAAGAASEEHDDEHGEHPFHHEFFRQQRAHQEQRRDENLAVKQLIRSSSVNKLFRKLAGILHPDRERDVTLRTEKNRLMGELIQARDNNDIPKLFAFYAEYVGGSPLDELGGNLDEAAQLLDRHFLDLRDQEDHILDEHPLTGALYRRFHKSTPAASKRAIAKHLKDIHSLTSALRDLPRDVTSINRLKPYLELRRDMLLRDADFDFM